MTVIEIIEESERETPNCGSKGDGPSNTFDEKKVSFSTIYCGDPEQTNAIPIISLFIRQLQKHQTRECE